MGKLIIVLGPTATGKTAFAARLAARLNGEVISADSRQVYRGMNIGTGKDYSDYIVGNTHIPFHLIDIVDPGYEYNVFEFRRDFTAAFHDIEKRGNNVILCGGTGMYIEAVIKDYRLDNVPENPSLRMRLETLGDEDLVSILQSYKSLHNVTDVSDRQRLIRAIEIQDFFRKNPRNREGMPGLQHIIFGIRFDRQTVRERISERLRKRLEEGLIEEVAGLLEAGVLPSQLRFYGLEYRFITDYLTGALERNEMVQKLETAIHQLAKRQMTWFRKMEREGVTIHWIDGLLTMDEKLSVACGLLNDLENKS
ncbi:MAG: tRNA (adenosine(37)-N6)-dimethylallyltransferase MiaA [Bacteroidales bacterium]|nr:tRNA (adenosine(37)-N6)-dimethylallyltransferase MiaA [Bacteroidales bacterium]